MSSGSLSQIAIPLYNGLFCTRVIEVKSEISFTCFDPRVTMVLSRVGAVLDISFDIPNIRLNNCFLAEHLVFLYCTVS